MVDIVDTLRKSHYDPKFAFNVELQGVFKVNLILRLPKLFSVVSKMTIKRVKGKPTIDLSAKAMREAANRLSGSIIPNKLEPSDLDQYGLVLVEFFKGLKEITITSPSRQACTITTQDLTDLLDVDYEKGNSSQH